MVILYNILIGFRIHTKLLQLIKHAYITPTAIYGYANLCLMFQIKSGLKGDALSSLLFNFALEYAIRKVKANHKLLKFNSTRKVIIYVDDVHLRGQSIQTIKVH
jgi:hypothetical protein